MDQQLYLVTLARTSAAFACTSSFSDAMAPVEKDTNAKTITAW